MWGNSGFGDNADSSRRSGGGFVPGQGTTPTGDKAVSRVKRTQNLFPVTVRQILESPDENLKIGDIEVAMVSIVGLVKSVEISTTKVSYIIDDQTGSIEAHTYIGTDDVGRTPVVLTENAYGRVVGSIRTNKVSSNNKYLLMFKALPVLDMNEITSHGLEVLMIPHKLKRMKDRQNARVGLGGGDSALPNSMIGVQLNGSASAATGTSSANTSLTGAGGQLVSGLTATQSLVYRCIQSVKEDKGIHVDQIVANLKNRLSPKEVKEGIELLSGEGHIYSSVDDDHFKCTDF